MKVAVEHKCDLIATSHWDINATLYKSRRGTQVRPDCDVASGPQCDMDATLYESRHETQLRPSCDIALGHECDFISKSTWKITAA